MPSDNEFTSTVESQNFPQAPQGMVQREQQLQWLRDSLRPGQQSLADWQAGSMAVSAVPGSGKSTGMAVGAAIAIARHQLHSQHQLVVVTFTRSAAASIKAKIRAYLKPLLLPQGGFVVQTLHGLALNIATRHPDLSGLNLENATVITPNQSHRLLKACVEQWIVANPRRYQSLLEGVQFDGEETERLRRQSVLRTEVLPSLAHTAVHEAKSSGLLPQHLWELSEQTTDEYDILGIAAGLAEQYQMLMRSRDFIDYDDMILAALRVLDSEGMRQLWQNQVFAVFEDEAQDSSPLQEKLLRTLATNPNHPDASPSLVRVGDPNQAINSTFTPADPIYFNWFCETCKAQKRFTTMDQAGRSSQIIIDAANFMLEWVMQGSGGAEEQRSGGAEENKPSTFNLQHAPFRRQYIRPVDTGDPQPYANPEPVGGGLEIYTPSDVHHTVKLIGKRVQGLLSQDSNQNAAVLVRENRQGRFIAEQLAYLERQHQIKVYEVSEVERHSHIPAEILKLLQFIDRPHSPDNLKAALEVLEKRQLIAAQDLNALATSPEQFLYPSPLDPPQKPHVEQACRYCCSLLRARLELPPYQLISFLGMSLKYTGSELATVQKLSERITKQTAGNSSLKAILSVLNEIVSSEQFEGVEEDADEQYIRPNQLTIITMHKAKGLDWDYVFLPFLHDDIIPGKPWVPTAAQFLGDFTLAEVARAQIRTAVHSRYQHPDSPLVLPQPAEAWEAAAQLKRAEEFRLLYVAMTRAKRLLWMAAAEKGPFRWNTFSAPQALQPKRPCPILPTLKRQFPQSVLKSPIFNF